MTTSSDRVGSVAKRLRKARKETLQEVAERAGVSLNQLWRIEQLASSPTEEKIRGIAEALDVPVSVLFGETQLLLPPRGGLSYNSPSVAPTVSPASSRSHDKLRAALAELPQEAQELVIAHLVAIIEVIASGLDKHTDKEGLYE